MTSATPVPVPGFTGPVCQIDIDDCSSTPCLNGAKCIDHPNGYECQCATGEIFPRSIPREVYLSEVGGCLAPAAPRPVSMGPFSVAHDLQPFLAVLSLFLPHLPPPPPPRERPGPDLSTWRPCLSGADFGSSESSWLGLLLGEREEFQLKAIFHWGSSAGGLSLCFLRQMIEQRARKLRADACEFRRWPHERLMQ